MFGMWEANTEKPRRRSKPPQKANLFNVPNRSPIGVLGRQVGKSAAADAVRAAIAPEELPGTNPENQPEFAAHRDGDDDDTFYD